MSTDTLEAIGASTRLMEARVYDSAEFTLGVVVDYDVKTEETNAFSNVGQARYVEIITDATIVIKLNLNTNHTITITSTEGVYRIKPLEERLLVSNIFITTTGAANIKLKLFP